MRTTTLLTTLLVMLTIHAHAQYHGRCGNFRYKINGKLGSSVVINNITTKTYYAIEPKTGYIWFWKEVSEPGNQQVNEFISMWARLSDIDTSCIESVSSDPPILKVRLTEKQNFFFTTSYTQQKKGPSYGVRNDILIPFKNKEAAINFLQQLKLQIPVRNY
ncbi:MAG: hypothetical protein IBJ16_03300 [Chitinophagaceae bacterium]|nr:hypothetical protein [Chitinophagaceae bacterium]